MAYLYDFCDVLLLSYKPSNFARAILPYAAGQRVKMPCTESNLQHFPRRRCPFLYAHLYVLYLIYGLGDLGAAVLEPEPRAAARDAGPSQRRRRRPLAPGGGLPLHPPASLIKATLPRDLAIDLLSQWIKLRHDMDTFLV